MRASNANGIRQLLRNNPDGMDVSAIANSLNREASAIRASLKRMPDAYIDRWEMHQRGFGIGYTSIWCVVVPPENCPKPTKKEKR